MDFVIIYYTGDRVWPQRALNRAAEKWGSSEVFVTPKKKMQKILPKPDFGGAAPAMPMARAA